MLSAPPLAAIPQTQFLGNSLEAWLVAGITTAVVALVLLVARRVLVSRLGALAARTETELDDTLVAFIGATRTWVIVAIAVYFGFRSLALWGPLPAYLDRAAKLAVLWQAGIWGIAVAAYWTKHHLDRRTAGGDRTSVAMIGAIGVVAKVIVWILIVLTALQTVFGINVATLVTGLGISGIAVALAVQNILGDLLATLAIVFDKPFDVGDTIGVDQIIGTVEHIGLKTTRLRSLSGEQVVIGNGDLLKSRLRNYRRMYQRRVVFALDITYDTPPDVIAKLPGIVKEVIEQQSPVRFDRAHVASLADSSIRLEVVYYVLDPDYAKYMDVQQAVILALLTRFAAENAKFAFPSRTVYHEGLTAKDVLVVKGAEGDV